MKKALLITAGLIWAAATLPFTALTGPARADALSDGKAAIDAWITTFGGIILSNQSVPSDFPNRLATALEKLPCHSKAEVAQVEAYIHQQINNIQHTHKVKIDYGLNTECRPAPGAQAAKDKPFELRTTARVWITRLQGLQAVGGQAQGKARGKGSAIAGVYGDWEKMGGLLRSQRERRLVLQHVA